MPRLVQPSPLAWGLVSFVVLAISASAGDPKAPPAAGEKAKDELHGVDLIGLLEDGKPKAVNGVTLRIKVKPTPADEPDAVEVQWTLKYSGPRPPLTILRPSLTDTALKARETELMVYATGKSKETFRYDFLSPAQAFGFFPFGPPAKRFLTIKEGKAGRDKLTVKIADIRDNFRKRKPDEYDRTTPPRLHVKLYFNPAERGAAHGLDAWTGELESNVVPLMLNKW